MHVRRRAWAAWGALALAVLLLALGNMAATKALNPVAALLVLAALGLFLSLHPVWARLLPPLPPMPGLSDRPSASQRWCVHCGRPAPRSTACASCGKLARAERRRMLRLQRKQRARVQEKKT